MSKLLTIVALLLGLTACGPYAGRQSNCWGPSQAAFAFDGTSTTQQDCTFTHTLPGAAH